MHYIQIACWLVGNWHTVKILIKKNYISELSETSNCNNNSNKKKKQLIVKTIAKIKTVPVIIISQKLVPGLTCISTTIQVAKV